jgi:hypothetical protein
MATSSALRAAALALATVCVLAMCASSVSADATFPFMNWTLPWADRVADLVSRLTLDEKVRPCCCVWRVDESLTRSPLHLLSIRSYCDGMPTRRDPAM